MGSGSVFQFPAESQANNNMAATSLTEEQKAEAERLKTDGEFWSVLQLQVLAGSGHSG